VFHSLLFLQREDTKKLSTHVQEKGKNKQYFKKNRLNFIYRPKLCPNKHENIFMYTTNRIGGPVNDMAADSVSYINTFSL
jgi:hypothetical protein